MKALRRYLDKSPTAATLRRTIDTDALLWAAGLLVLAPSNPRSDFHFTLFWPQWVFGIQSPGYGLGHSIGYLFRGDLLGQIGMGLLYLFTAGFCLIGTIIDVVNHKKLAFQYNQLKAQTIATLVKGST